MKEFSQEQAQSMYTQLRYTQIIASLLGFKVLAGKIEDCLELIDKQLEATETSSANQPTSTKLTTSEYAAIHAVDKFMRGE